MAYLLLAGRWLLAIVLASSGFAKLLAPTRGPVVDAIERYGVLPQSLVRPFGFVLPWIEVILGLMLAAGILVVPSAALTATLLTIFALVIGWHVSLGRRFDCGCGHGGLISWRLAARDLMFGVLSVAVALGPSGGLALWAGPGTAKVHSPARSLLPLPLLVIVMVVTLQLIILGCRLWSGLGVATRGVR